MGKVASIELKGATLFTLGSIEVTFKVYDKNNEPLYTLNKINIDASGGQFASIKATGVIGDFQFDKQITDFCGNAP